MPEGLLLLLDSCTAHGPEDNVPCLDHLTVPFLPPEASSHTQPCGTGIIACTNSFYKICILMRALDNIDKEIEDI